jgi:hypothetical protein
MRLRVRQMAPASRKERARHRTSSRGSLISDLNIICAATALVPRNQRARVHSAMVWVHRAALIRQVNLADLIERAPQCRTRDPNCFRSLTQPQKRPIIVVAGRMVGSRSSKRVYDGTHFGGCNSLISCEHAADQGDGCWFHEVNCTTRVFGLARSSKAAPKRLPPSLTGLSPTW